MRLLDEEDIQRNRLKNQKKKKSLIIIIILLSILSALIMAFIVLIFAPFITLFR